MKKPNDELVRRVTEYAKRNKGIYAPILHPVFDDVPFYHGPERWNIIAPQLGHEGGSVLDIGSHWGYFAHMLENSGYNVTAVEHGKEHLYFLKEIRDLCNKRFEVIPSSVFDLKHPKFDIVLALCVFHHYLKKEESFVQLCEFLDRLETKCIILQSHNEDEKQMQTAFRKMGPEEFAEFIAKRVSLNKIETIGQTGKRGGRKIFKLSA